tara:strand:+ start:274 stop:552 length:279 start_codon:yes stop_codon:yes gene_type:complete
MRIVRKDILIDTEKMKIGMIHEPPEHSLDGSCGTNPHGVHLSLILNQDSIYLKIYCKTYINGIWFISNETTTEEEETFETLNGVSKITIRKT